MFIIQDKEDLINYYSEETEHPTTAVGYAGTGWYFWDDSDDTPICFGPYHNDDQAAAAEEFYWNDLLEEESPTFGDRLKKALPEIGTKARKTAFAAGRPICIYKDGKVIWQYENGDEVEM